MLREPTVWKLRVRRGFSLNGTQFKKGQVAEFLVHGSMVVDGVELAGLSQGNDEPIALPWEFLTDAEVTAE